MKVTFNGRRVGSIGHTYQIVAEVSNDPIENYWACQLELHKLGYEHIMFIKKCNDTKED